MLKSKTCKYGKLNIISYKILKFNSFIYSYRHEIYYHKDHLSFALHSATFNKQHFAHYGRPASDYNTMVVWNSHNNRPRTRATIRMRPELGNVDPTTSISSLDASAASTEPEIVSVTIDKVLTLDSTSFKIEVVLSLQSHDGVLECTQLKR